MFGFGKRKKCDESTRLEKTVLVTEILESINRQQTELNDVKRQACVLRTDGVKIKQLLADLTDKQIADHHECLKIMRHNAEAIDTLRTRMAEVEKRCFVIDGNFTEVTERANTTKQIVGDFITHLVMELEALYENLTDKLSVREQENSDSGV